MSQKEETVDCKYIPDETFKDDASNEDECDTCLIDYQNNKEFCSLCNFDLKKLKCNECNNLLDLYKDVDDSGICFICDRQIDETPYDPYWEQMANEFSSSPEYKNLKKRKLLNNEAAYEAAYEEYQENYESWYDMRRRMAGKVGKK